MSGRAEADTRRDARIAHIQIAAASDAEQGGLETRRVANREELLRIGTWTAVATQLFRNRQRHVKPAIRGASVTRAATFDDRLGGVENPVHVNSFPHHMLEADNVVRLFGGQPLNWD